MPDETAHARNFTLHRRTLRQAVPYRLHNAALLPLSGLASPLARLVRIFPSGHFGFVGETYYWSKDCEFLNFIVLPKRIAQLLELATDTEDLPADGCSRLRSNGWPLANADAFTTNPRQSRDYVRFSWRNLLWPRISTYACIAGASATAALVTSRTGAPKITQDTGFETVLPTGNGRFAFNTIDETTVAFDAVRSDYQRHAQVARVIIPAYFRAETVLSRLLLDLGL